jgi:putative NADH-flavin reductase
MKLLVFGASGAIGSAITAELLERGHTVTAATRSGTPIGDVAVQVVKGDAADPASVARLAHGQDGVVSAIGPRRGQAENEEDSLLGAARGLTEGLRQAGVRRLVIVGGAGSLEVAPGQRLVDTPGFPAGWKPTALAHARALDVFREVDDLDWTYVSPAAEIGPGERTGKFRIGGDQLVVDDAGDSRISIPDYAIAIADEIERGEAIRRRITVAY